MIRTWHRWRRGLIGIATAAALLSCACFLALYWPEPVPSFAAVRAAYVPSDAWLLDRQGVVLASTRIRFDVRRLAWVPLTEVSPAFVTAVVGAEDRRFWQHHGIDWRSVLGAARDHILHRRQRGASTLTMQLATLLRHRHGAHGTDALFTKFEQARLALALERHWTKPQILEAYLNLVSYQGDLQGIGAAAAQLTAKAPSGLTLPESLVLAALLPEPGASTPRIIARACTRARTERLNIDCSAIRATAIAMTGPGTVSPADPLASRLAHELLKTPGERLRTTLDARIQRVARDIVRSQLSALSDRNVRDGAALVVDNATGDVLAYVASAGPESRAAQVDGIQAPRQAGSTLKPFLYELALERRFLTAASLLQDSPLSLETASGVYIPQDYDHDFKGLVSVRTALASSLNVPAVRTLVLVGVEAFRDRLRALGYSGITHDGEYYGYSLALGSAEVTLWQQAQAYRALARGGEWSPLRLTPGDATPASTRLLPAGATFIVDDILSDPAARAVTFGLDSHLDTPFWTAVKTGTSEDTRDNWCVGFSRHFTVAVWVGNFEGDSMHDVSGVTGAGPIWHELMAALQQGLSSTSPAAPAGVVARTTRFSPAVEPARHEWYLRDTVTADQTVAAVPQSARPGIQSPANGMIIAIDPDIPPDHQRILISLQGARTDMQLKLNGHLLGPAVPEQLWTPRPGAYYLTLADRQGHELDRILFTVRGSR